MQSDGRLEYEATEKTAAGGMKNVVYRTEGPTVIVQTTTKNHLHPENETRVFPIYIDESEEQTGRIVESILKDAAGHGVSDAERERVQERGGTTPSACSNPRGSSYPTPSASRYPARRSG
jgi:hypothetical protein